MNYRGVKIHALVESIDYYHINENGDYDGVLEHATDPRQIGWNVFGMDGIIDQHLDCTEYPTLDDVKKLIDGRIEDETV